MIHTTTLKVRAITSLAALGGLISYAATQDEWMDGSGAYLINTPGMMFLLGLGSSFIFVGDAVELGLRYLLNEGRNKPSNIKLHAHLTGGLCLAIAVVYAVGTLLIGESIVRPPHESHMPSSHLEIGIFTGIYTGFMVLAVSALQSAWKAKQVYKGRDSPKLGGN